MALALPAALAAGSPGREAWLKERRDFIEMVKSDPSEKNVDALVERFSDMGFHLQGAEGEYLAIHGETRKVLAAIPTLPDLLHERILKARAEQQSRPTQELRDGAYSRTMGNVVRYFGVLKRLRTPASIRVLGEMLSDHRGAFDPDSYKGGDIRFLIQVRTSNSQYAVEHLMVSPLEGKPLVLPHSQKEKPTREQIAVWERWYGRIKAGQATFRFEGDPTEYDLDGPASPEKLARLRANRERDEALEKRRSTAANRTGGPISNDHPPPSGASANLPWPGLLAGSAAVLAALGWYFIIRRRQADAN